MGNRSSGRREMESKSQSRWHKTKRWLVVTFHRGSMRQPVYNQFLWALAGVAAVADLFTTAAGLHRGFVESNPVGVFALDVVGFAGLLAIKLAVIAGAILFCGVLRSLPDAIAPDVVLSVVPLSLAVVWSIAAIWNGMLLSGAGPVLEGPIHAGSTFPFVLIALSLLITVCVSSVFVIAERTMASPTLS